MDTKKGQGGGQEEGTRGRDTGKERGRDGKEAGKGQGTGQGRNRKEKEKENEKGTGEEERDGNVIRRREERSVQTAHYTRPTTYNKTHIQHTTRCY